MQVIRLGLCIILEHFSSNMSTCDVVWKHPVHKYTRLALCKIRANAGEEEEKGFSLLSSNNGKISSTGFWTIRFYRLLYLPFLGQQVRLEVDPDPRHERAIMTIRNLVESYVKIIHKEHLDMVPKTIMCLVLKDVSARGYIVTSSLYFTW